MFADDPPNATMIAHREVGDETDVAVVVTLSEPMFDEASGTLTYNARILSAEQIQDRVFEDAPLSAVDEPQEFAEAHLFIDNAPSCFERGLISRSFTLGMMAAVCSQYDDYAC
ncbi:MAG: hypothetical protein R2845_14530 [Thermomicrobiales bacterium]